MTLGEALNAFILADATISATIQKVYPANAIPQEPPQYFASYRFLPAGSVGDSHDGLSRWQRMRIEVTFWGVLNATTERLAFRLQAIASVNGPLVSGGPTVSIYKTIGPRSMENPISRYFSNQMDLMALVNTDTIS